MPLSVASGLWRLLQAELLLFHVPRPQSVLSSVAFGYGCENLAKYEQQGEGIQWYNMNQSPEDGVRYTFTMSIVMLLVDSALYWTLTWYIENVFPGGWN